MRVCSLHELRTKVRWGGPMGEYNRGSGERIKEYTRTLVQGSHEILYPEGW